MTDRSARRSIARRVLIVALILAALVLAGAGAMLVPILTHQSVGGSGQALPEGFVAQTLASDAGLALPGSRMYVLDPQLRHRPTACPGIST